MSVSYHLFPSSEWGFEFRSVCHPSSLYHAGLDTSFETHLCNLGVFSYNEAYVPVNIYGLLYYPWNRITLNVVGWGPGDRAACRKGPTN